MYELPTGQTFADVAPTSVAQTGRIPARPLAKMPLISEEFKFKRNIEQKYHFKDILGT